MTDSSDAEQPPGSPDSAAPARAAEGTGGTAEPDDALSEAMSLVTTAADAGITVRLLGGMAVRVLCPDYPPRRAAHLQDIDLASVTPARKALQKFLLDQGHQPDKNFNALYGHKQLYFVSAVSGRPIDVLIDRLVMCHELDFRERIGRMPYTLDVLDVLLSKLQIVELNEKDARDIFQLLAGLPIGGGAPPMMDTGRFGKVLGADWGWWRTVTENLAKLPALLTEKPGLAPPAPRFDPLAQARQLLDLAELTPKGVKWKIRANVGDRVRWYELPEEVAH